MLVWLGQAVNSSVAPIRTKKTAAFFNTIMASPLMFELIEGEAMIIPKLSTDYTDEIQICVICGWIYFPNQPMGRPERSTQTLFTCVYRSSAWRPISRPYPDCL